MAFNVREQTCCPAPASMACAHTYMCMCMYARSLYTHGLHAQYAMLAGRIVMLGVVAWQPGAGLSDHAPVPHAHASHDAWAQPQVQPAAHVHRAWERTPSRARIIMARGTPGT